VCSVTLGRWANSFVLTCCRPMLGMGLLTAGGNTLRAGADPNAGCEAAYEIAGAVLSMKRRAYSIHTSDIKNSPTGKTIGAPSSIKAQSNMKTGMSTPLKNINLAARRMCLRRGEGSVSCV